MKVCRRLRKRRDGGLTDVKVTGGDGPIHPVKESLSLSVLMNPLIRFQTVIHKHNLLSACSPSPPNIPDLWDLTSVDSQP